LRLEGGAVVFEPTLEAVAAALETVLDEMLAATDGCALKPDIYIGHIYIYIYIHIYI